MRGLALSARSEPSRFIRAILQRLGQAYGADPLLAYEVGNRARHAQRAVDGARRHAAAVDCVGDELDARSIERAVLAQRSVRKKRIERTALMLPRARCQDALTHHDARFTGRNAQQFFRRKCRHLNLNINPIQNRS